MSKLPTIHISGAGLVGSLLAVMLGQRGYQVTLLERRADMRREEVDSGRSINLALSSRGIQALQHAGLMDEVQKLLIPMKGRMLHFQHGHQEFMPYGQRESEVIYSVSRRDLNQLMMARAEQAEPVTIRFEQKLESIDLENRRLVTRDLRTDAVREEPFVTLIGADGAGSRTRRAIMPSVDGQATSEFLDHDYKELEIPPSKDASASPFGRFQIEPNALHIWPRSSYMLIALPNMDGSFTVTLFMPRTGPDSFEMLDQAGQVTRFFSEHFPDALKLIPDLQQDYEDHPQGRLGTLRCSRWYHPAGVLLVGDAAHAIVPFHGQGMNSGFEDCSVLLRLLDEFQDDWSQVMPAFEAERLPNAEAIADMALENYVTMRHSVADPKFQLKKELGFDLERRMPDRFVPRYSMVMFRLVDYAVAMRRGEIQAAILDQLATGIESVDEVDWAYAEKLVIEKLDPLPPEPSLMS